MRLLTSLELTLTTCEGDCDVGSHNAYTINTDIEANAATAAWSFMFGRSSEGIHPRMACRCSPAAKCYHLSVAFGLYARGSPRMADGHPQQNVTIYHTIYQRRSDYTPAVAHATRGWRTVTYAMKRIRPLVTRLLRPRAQFHIRAHSATSERVAPALTSTI